MLMPEIRSRLYPAAHRIDVHPEGSVHQIIRVTNSPLSCEVLQWVPQFGIEHDADTILCHQRCIGRHGTSSFPLDILPLDAAGRWGT